MKEMWFFRFGYLWPIASICDRYRRFHLVRVYGLPEKRRKRKTEFTDVDYCNRDHTCCSDLHIIQNAQINHK